MTSISTLGDLESLFNIVQEWTSMTGVELLENPAMLTRLLSYLSCVYKRAEQANAYAAACNLACRTHEYHLFGQWWFVAAHIILHMALHGVSLLA